MCLDMLPAVLPGWYVGDITTINRIFWRLTMNDFKNRLTFTCPDCRRLVPLAGSRQPTNGGDRIDRTYPKIAGPAEPGGLFCMAETVSDLAKQGKNRFALLPPSDACDALDRVTDRDLVTKLGDRETSVWEIEISKILADGTIMCRLCGSY